MITPRVLDGVDCNACALVLSPKLDADPCSLFESYSWLPSIIQQIHDIVEASTEALLRHGTGGFAVNQGELVAMSPFGCKVGVAERHVRFDLTIIVEFVLCHEAPQLRQSCKASVRTVAKYHRGECARKKLTDVLSLQLRFQTVLANPTCAGINVIVFRREKLAHQTARTENVIWCGCEIPAKPNKIAEHIEQTSGSARLQVTRHVFVPAECAELDESHPIVVVLISLEKHSPCFTVVLGKSKSLLRSGAGTVNTHVPVSSMGGEVFKLRRRATIEIAVDHVVLEFWLREDDIRDRDIWIRAWRFGVNPVGMDSVHEQKGGPISILVCGPGSDVDLLSERQVLDNRLLDLCRLLNHPLEGSSAFC